jgi:FtsP/CotA-like multicopper oxidase with cupredoxin domain
MTRRAALGLAATTAGALYVGAVARARAASTAPLVFASPRLEPFVDELPRLPMRAAGGDLVAAEGAHRFHRDLPRSRTWGYGGQDYLGPVLEAQAGEPVDLHVHNQLGSHVLAPHLDLSLDGTTVDDLARPRIVTHLHGGVTEPGSDGHPLQSVRPMGARSHHYGGGQEAAGLWYHDHAMGITRLNVYAGLAGPYLLRDRFDTGLADNPLGLPAGEFELPLVLQDKIFDASGHLGFRLARYVAAGSWEGGQAGDVPCVNGVAWPKTQVARGLYRLRVLNGSNLRSYRLSFSGGVRFWVIGGDGGLLDAPVLRESVPIAAAERLDLLVDFSGLKPGESVDLRNAERLPAQFLVTGSDVRIPTLMRFTATAARGFTGAVPARLRGGPNQPHALARFDAPVRVRTLTVLQLLDFSRFPPAMMSLNNLPFASRDIDRPAPGTVERWDVVNMTTDEHPIHVHLASLRVLRRQPFNGLLCAQLHPFPRYGVRYAPPAARYRWGRATGPGAWESGNKDTVLAPPGVITSLLVRWPSLDELGFDPDASFTVPSTIAEGAPGMSQAAESMPMSMHAVNTGPDHRDRAMDAADGMEGMAGMGAGTAHVDATPTAPQASSAVVAGASGPPSTPAADAVCRLSPEIQPTPSQARGYVWHCHVLDHEDHDMMQSLRVVAS